MRPYTDASPTAFRKTSADLAKASRSWSSICGSITIVACYLGLRTRGGTEGVGRSTTQAVVVSSVLILASDFFLTKLFIEVFGH